MIKILWKINSNVKQGMGRAAYAEVKWANSSISLEIIFYGGTFRMLYIIFHSIIPKDYAYYKKNEPVT